MQNLKLCLDHKRYHSKPSDIEVPRLSKRIGGQTVRLNDDNIRGFVGDIALDGRTFCPATFKNGRQNRDNFEQMQLFVLDFDNDKPGNLVSFDEVKRRADKYNLPILFAYESFRSKRKDRFRVVFQNDVPITDIRDAELIQNSLMTVFPESDPQCKSVVQMYFGGGKDEMLFFDEHMPKLNVYSTITGMTGYLEDRHGKNYRRKLDEFIRSNRLATNSRGMPDVSITHEPPLPEKNAEATGAPPNEEISPNSSIRNNTSLIVGFGEKSSALYHIIRYDDGTNTSAPKEPSRNHATLRAKDIPRIRSACQLFREFEDGSRRLSHKKLFGLATNLNNTNVETGTTVFMDIFKKNASADSRIHKIDYWNHQLKKYISGFKPQSCVGYCPYHESCSHGTNIISTVNVKYRQWERIANYDENLCSLAEAEADLTRVLNLAYTANDTNWHIIKAQTAIGKTRAYLYLLKKASGRVLIVVPTNKLKREIQERAAELGIEIVVSPSLHELEDELPVDVWQHIKKLYDSGQSVIPYLKKTIAEDNPECSAILKNYLKELDEFNNCNGHAITTHRRYLSMDVSKYDLVIVDEDIIFNTIIPNKTDISIRKLRKLREKLPANSLLARKINKIIKHIKSDEFFTLSSVHYDKRDYADISMAVDISALCAAKHFCFRKDAEMDDGQAEDYISFPNPVEFKGDTKHIMLSATVDETICEYIFNDNMKFYQCRKAKNKGTLNQDYRQAMSRRYLGKDTSIFGLIKAWSNFEYTISFKKFLEHYDGDLYFGNCAGCDYLKGEDIDVIGTPHQPDWIYKLFAYSLDLEFDADSSLRNQSVEHNGYKFRFPTFDDKALKDIQFYMIESELEQAVGRARLLRCNCTVNLFSPFPLSQTNPMEADYDSRS